MFISNKYYKWYSNIIKNAQANPRTEGDRHHIIPRSMGGSNSKTNIVRLTWREHFVCHLLLVKCVQEKKDIRNMSWAVHRMAFSKRNKITSWEFAAARRVHIQNLKNDHHSRRDPEWIPKLRIRMKASYESNPSLRISRRIHLKQTWANNRDVMIEHQRLASAKGTRVKAERRAAGEVFRTSEPRFGSDNPAAKHISLKNNQTGELVESDCVKDLCRSLNLSYDCIVSMRRGKIKNHRGYSIWKGDSAND